MPWSKHICSVTFALASILPAGADTPSAVTASNPTPGNSILVTGTAGSTIYVFVSPKGATPPKCDGNATASMFPTNEPPYTLKTSAAEAVPLADNLVTGSVACIVMETTTLDRSAAQVTTSAPANPATNPLPTIVDGTLALGNSFVVTAPPQTTVHVYINLAAKPLTGAKCSSAPNVGVSKFTPDKIQAMGDASAIKLTLTTTLSAGDQVCLATTSAATTPAFQPTLYTVAAPTAPVAPVTTATTATAAPMSTGAAAAAVNFSGGVAPGTAVSLTGTAGETVSIYPISPGTDCDKDAITAKTAKPLSITSTMAGGPALTSFLLTTIPLNVTLTAAVNAGDKLCLAAVAAKAPTGSDPTEFAATTVTAASPVAEPWFAHSFFTFGAVASNQLSAANSTSAAQYVDLGFAFNFFTEKPETAISHRTFGLNSTFSGRFSTMPVAAPVAPAPAGSAGSTPTTNVNNTLNILSSQESARIMGTLSTPRRISPTSAAGDALYAALVAKGSFSTLINPTTTLPTTNGGSATVQYSPTYNDWSIGGRVGWRNYTGESPSKAQTVWELDATFGKYSNLQEIQCGKVFSATGQTTIPTNTSCYQTISPPSNSPSGTPLTYNIFSLNRVSVPRLEISGYGKIPGTIFVVGIDANLAQYSLLTPKSLDTLNRSGSDVRIYFGISGNITDLFSKLGIGSSAASAAATTAK